MTGCIRGFLSSCLSERQVRKSSDAEIERSSDWMTISSSSQTSSIDVGASFSQTTEPMRRSLYNSKEENRSCFFTSSPIDIPNCNPVLQNDFSETNYSNFISDQFSNSSLEDISNVKDKSKFMKISRNEPVEVECHINSSVCSFNKKIKPFVRSSKDVVSVKKLLDSKQSSSKWAKILRKARRNLRRKLKQDPEWIKNLPPHPPGPDAASRNISGQA